MKRILLALTLVGLLLPLTPRAHGATEVSLNFFYDNLSPYGSWLEVSDYGYVFQPSVAVDNYSWRPYADGYWAYTDVGWTWVSYEDFGWATYHYGRWIELADYGWVWVPGYEWGPAWVSWRTGGDYIGWAPLPPAAPRVYEGRVITGQVDLQFDIGPLYYNFVDIRYIGEPVLRQRIIEPQRNVTIINQTVNVTNITYNNSVVYNYGPDFNRVNEFSTRPVQRLSIQRETTVGADLQNKRGNLNRVSGNQLVVVAPLVQKSAQKIAPKQVKARVEKPKMERGWQGVQNRQQLQEEMKKENARNVPPPSFQPARGGKGQAATADEEKTSQPNAAAVGATSTSNERQAESAGRKGRDEQNARKAEQAPKAQAANPEQSRQNMRDERTQQAEQRRAERERQQQANKRDQTAPGTELGQRAEQTEAENNRRVQESRNPERERRRQAKPEQESQNAREARARAQQAESQQNAGARQRAKQAEQGRQQDQERQQRAQRNQPRERTQQVQQAPQRERGPQSSREGVNRGQQAGQPRERAQQAQPRNQGQGEQSNERKGKKKRANEEQPQP